MDGAAVTVAPNRIAYRASQLGNCTRQLVAIRQGYEPLPPPKAVGVRFAEGHKHEEIVVERMRSEGWTVWDQQLTVELQVSGKLVVVGHIDGKCTETVGSVARTYLLEVKSQSDNEFRAYKSDWSHGFFPGYKWQQSVYMHATELPLALVRKNRDTGEQVVEYFDEPWYTAAEIRSRVIEIERLALRGDIDYDCDRSSYPCPVYYLHDQEEVNVLSVEDSEEIALLAGQYDASKRAGKVAEGKAKASRDALRAALGLKLNEDGTVSEKKTVDANGVRVSFYNQKNSPGLDRTAVEKDLPAGRKLSDYQKQTESERLRVTMPKTEE